MSITDKRPEGKRGLPRPKCHLIKVCEYVYRDPRGRELFTKVRYRHDPCICGRGKSFSYFWRPAYLKHEWDMIWRKPPDADGYLYRLDEFYPLIARGERGAIYWAEGEKDADAIVSRKAPATSHHQGAGKATQAQAAWLVKAKHVVIVADLDDAGAYCAAHRHDLLIEAGCKGQIDIVRAAEGNDAADHIAAGRRLAEFVPVDIDRLRKAAHRYKSDLKNNGSRYTGGDYA
jgi:hypothetical protein